MIVAGAGVPQRIAAAPARLVAAGPSAATAMISPASAGDQRRGEPVIGVPALLGQGEEPAFIELGEMLARGLRRDAAGIGEFKR
jgi:hypothetical protein